MPLVQNRKAAYVGARFDASGFCLTHSDILLCKPVDGKYKTIRKICPKCGSSTLVNQRKGRRKTVPHSGVPRTSTTAGDIMGAERRAGKSQRRASQDAPAITKANTARRASKNATAGARAKAGSTKGQNPHASGKRSKPPINGRKVRNETKSLLRESTPNPAKNPPAPTQTAKNPTCKRRRGRSLSPPRKSAPETPIRPMSSELVKKKVTDQKLKELMHLMPPLYRGDPSVRNHKINGTEGGQSQKSTNMPFDENGHCKAHPEVRLAKKSTKQGEWVIVSGVCPQCCASAVIACKQKQSSTTDTPFLANSTDDGSDEMIGKVLTTSNNLTMSPLLPLTPTRMPKPGSFSGFIPPSDLTKTSPRERSQSNTNTDQRKQLSASFDKNGYCVTHPKIRLAKKSTNGGEWDIICGVCPQCCVSAVMACKRQQSPAVRPLTLAEFLNGKGGPTNDATKAKVPRTTSCGSRQTLPTSSTSSSPSTPESVSRPAFSDDYFTSANRNIVGLALDISRSEKMVADLHLDNTSSDNTLKRGNALGVSKATSKEPPGRRL